MQPNGAQAQTISPTFSTAVLNPFGLTANGNGRYTVPAFADLDNDGDLDMLSGLRNTGPSFAYYQNIGTNVSPSFTAAVGNPFGLTDIASSYATPAFADLDHDGDMDIIAGDYYGNFNYYQNVGTTSAPSFTVAALNPFGLTVIAGGSYSHPSFADMDNDGDLDMMASSENDNNFYYFENTGTSSVPAFAAAVMNPFGLTQGYSWMGAVLGDIDNDGDFDIMSQSGNGDFYYSENTGTKSAPAFATAVMNPFVLRNLQALSHRYDYTTAFVDLNNDGRLDLMTGDQQGNFIFNKNTPLPGAALNFNGSNNYVSAPVFNVFTNNITLQASVNWAGTTGANQMIITNGNTGSAGYSVFVDHSNSDQLSVVLGGVTIMQSTASLSTNTWQNVALVCDAGTWSLYVDGNNYALSNNTSIPNAVIGSFAIGADQGGAENFNGSIDETRLWGRALCLGEIQNYLTGELPMPQNSLVAYYKFNEGIGFANNSSVTTLADSSGNGHNLTLHNFTLNGTASNWVTPGGVIADSIASAFVSPIIAVSGSNYMPAGQTTTLTAHGATTYMWDANTGNATTASVAVSPTVTTTYSVQGTVSGCLSNIVYDTVHVGNFQGAALNFDGVNDYVDASNSINTTLSAGNKITVEAWVNPANTNYYGCIVGNYQTSGGGMQFLLRRDGNKYVFWVDNGSGFNNVTSSLYVTQNTWTHVAGTWDGNVLSIYENGVLTGTTSVVGTNLISSTNAVWLGGNTAGTPEMFAGSVDEVRIWNRALCQGEIVNNMHAEVKLPQTGLLAYYKLNEGIAADNNATVTTATDSSGNAYNGTLNNFTLNGVTSNWIIPGAITIGSYAPVFTIPNLTVTGNTTICVGTITTLTATGATTYTWTSGSHADTTMVNPPVGNTTYTVTGSYLGCSPNTAVTTVSVNPTPTVTVASATVCAGNTATLTANGTATSYTWSTTETTASITATPTITASYTVSVTDANGCMNMATASIDVNSLPTIMVTTPTVCAGNTATLTASGTATSYTWSTNATTASISATPTTTANYTVSGTDANGCMNMVPASIDVNMLPTISVSSSTVTLCSGSTATLTAGGSVTSFTGVQTIIPFQLQLVQLQQLLIL